MGGFISAWLVALGFNVWDHTAHTLNKNNAESSTNFHVYAPPQPKQLFLISGLFAMLALLAEIPDAKRVATLIAWGVDIAYFAKIAQTGATAQPLEAHGTYTAYASGPWPPAVAPNNVIIPNGSQKAATANANPSSNPTSSSGAGSSIVPPLTA